MREGLSLKLFYFLILVGFEHVFFLPIEGFTALSLPPP
jgi:hypothetical protein